ncbi:hypothetical protein PUN28_016162 [Cardiocondyla obscurior]|uniref:Uncharacterized protein n=1 Tax=Cardiocondyla obscurior TaxID=286306 RepID=A0AAW2ER84_9HYME
MRFYSFLTTIFYSPTNRISRFFSFFFFFLWVNGNKSPRAPKSHVELPNNKEKPRMIEKGRKGEKDRERNGEKREEKKRREVVGERENKQLHKDRSWRVPGASLHTMHLCLTEKEREEEETGGSLRKSKRGLAGVQAALIKEEERSASAECAILLVRARLANGRAL